MDIKNVELLYGDMIKKFKQELNGDETHKCIVTNAIDEENKVIKNKYQIRIVEETIWNKNYDSWSYEDLKYVSCPLDKETLDIILKLINE